MTWEAQPRDDVDSHAQRLVRSTLQTLRRTPDTTTEGNPRTSRQCRSRIIREPEHPHEDRDSMTDPRNTEPQGNYVLARALRRRNPEWTDSTVHAERTNVIQLRSPDTGASKRPDIVVAPPRYQAVIVETEFAPARTVEKDATARLGTELSSTGAEVEGTLSVVLPEHLRTGDLEAIENASFRYATHYLDGAGNKTRWPSAGSWLEGGVDDLADAIEFLALSERRLT